MVFIGLEFYGISDGGKYGKDRHLLELADVGVVVIVFFCDVVKERVFTAVGIVQAKLPGAFAVGEFL